MSVLAPVQNSLRKVFGSRNDRVIKAYTRRAAEIEALEPEFQKLSDPEMLQRSNELRRALTDGEKRPNDVLAEGFALMREALDRHVGIRNIFSPEFKGQLDFDKLPDDAKQLYRETEQQIEQTPPAEVLGAADPVPGWLQVDIPQRLYEAVRELYPDSKPPFRTRPFMVQLIGGMVLYEGKIAEMKTGEGKTIVAPLACYMAALEGMQCHMVTVNDYLVQRDRDWVFPAFHKLGITVGAIHPFHVQPPEKKQEAYRCDVVYGTNSEFGFDYLRDNMKLSVDEQVQRRRDFCIVDEIDSILIDEARTPLIISGPAHDDAPQYMKANQVAEQLVVLQRQANEKTRERIKQDGFVERAANAAGVQPSQVEKTISKFRDLGPDFLEEKEAEQIDHTQYYVVKRESKTANMTELGVQEAQKIVGTRFYVVGNDMAWDHLINNALRAHTVFEKDQQYVVQDGKVIIVDEFTGRLMHGRQWSDGLHQAVEAKESRHGVKIENENQTLATITIQNFFKLYKRLAGMTGTAITEATEFADIYKLDVVCVPTNVPVIRDDENDLIYLTKDAKWKAILDEIRETAQAGRPVLVGTTSVDNSEYLSQYLGKRYGLEHEVLNAKQHEREAHIIEKAGQQTQDKKGRTVGNITIATNMAGRGTDIRLGSGVAECGGLHIVGTERHESRRIDNQLRGRSGRQGDPGSSRFFISMEDDLMKMFAGQKTMKALSAFGMQEDEAIEHRWITRSVEKAQRKVEEQNYQRRKEVLEYDEVMEHQRQSFYGTRQAALEGRRIKQLVFDYIAESIEDAVGRFLDPQYPTEQLAEAVRSMLGVSIEPSKLRGENVDEVTPTIRSDAKADQRQEIEVTVGEYMSEDGDPAESDFKGLQNWAMSRFSVDLKQSQLRQSTANDVIELLTEHAHDIVDRKPLDALEKFFDPNYAPNELATWARDKFALELTADELTQQTNESPEQAQQRVANLIYERAERAYRRREVEYPVDFELELVFGTAQQGGEATAWAADQLVRWANQRFDLGWTLDTVTAMNGEEIQRALFDASEQWHGEKLDEWVKQTLADGPDVETIDQRFADRWGRNLNEADREALEDAEGDERTELLRDAAHYVLRSELTQLEQYVLLQILDQTWKDHLYAMDQLQDSVRLRGFAEKDPKNEFKSEGSRYFTEMLRNVRDKVTDMIFRAKLTPQVEMSNVYQNQQAEHESSGSTGVQAAAPGGTDQQRADLEAAQRAGTDDQSVTATIVNKTEKVGRNDPCPCGSGKKYKKCCGRAA